MEENSPPQADFLKVFKPLLRSEMQNSLTNPSVFGIKTQKICACGLNFGPKPSLGDQNRPSLSKPELRALAGGATLFQNYPSYALIINTSNPLSKSYKC